MSNFKLTKIVKSFADINKGTYNQYQFYKNDMYIDMLIHEDDEKAAQWYEMYKEFWQPETKEIICHDEIEGNKFSLEKKIKYRVTPSLITEKQYSLIIWNDCSIAKSKFSCDDKSISEILPLFIEEYKSVINNFEIIKLQVEEVMFID